MNAPPPPTCDKGGREVGGQESLAQHLICLFFLAAQHLHYIFFPWRNVENLSLVRTSNGSFSDAHQ